MTGTGSGPGVDPVWAIVAVLALGTFALRLSFIELYARLGDPSPAVERWLGLVPAAVLAALVTPALVSLDGSLVTARSVAGAVAAVVAWRTGSMTATIAVGMAVLWGLQWAVG